MIIVLPIFLELLLWGDDEWFAFLKLIDIKNMSK
jgi:hypothetical protein